MDGCLNYIVFFIAAILMYLSPVIISLLKELFCVVINILLKLEQIDKNKD